MMCHDLSAELAQFDLQKEKEFKQMLLDYAAAQLEKHEKVSSASMVALFPRRLQPTFSVLGWSLGMRLSFVVTMAN